ncbi:MAG: hypothetical protein WKF62_01570 [Solirubrobacterales bacterium]
MGIFSGFFDRRRQRESAIPHADEPAPATAPGTSEGTPVGQPIEGVGQPLNLNFGTGQPDVAGILGMVSAAMQTGQFQIQQSDSQTVDLRGTPEGQALREQIENAMRQAGVDPAMAAEGAQVNAADYAGLQEQILKTLKSHGVEASGQISLPPDTDGDSQPD